MAKPLTRLRVVQLAFAAGAVAVLGRAAYVQLVRGAEYAGRAAAQRTEEVELPARRGAVLDRRGVPLALTQEVYHVGVAPNELQNRDRDARTVARALGLGAREVLRRLQRRYAYFHGPYSSTHVEPLRTVRGVHLTSELVRFHPDPDLARGILGQPAADGRPASGLERELDSLLTGTPGRAVVLRDRSGRRYESPSRLGAFPVPGHDVTLTIDAELQEIAEQALADAMERYDATGGDVVVVAPHTGEVLAMASHRVGGGGSAGALTSVFEPGSTAKLFAAAALLNHDLVSTTDSVWTEEGEYDLGVRVIHDDHPSGWLTLTGVLEQSSNIGIVKFAARLSPEQQYGMLRDFGLGTPTAIDYPTESGGILRRPSQWSGTTAASLAMGYEVAVTPLQLALAYGAVANGGVLMQPALVREVRRSDGTVTFRSAPRPVRRVVSPAVAASLRAMLRGVVFPGGTGETAALSVYEVAGKTGTARRAGPGGYIPGSYTASFASLFPAEDPQLVMVVKLDDPHGAYARLTAAPVTREVLEALLASPNTVLDRTRLTVSRVPEPRDAPLGAGSTPWVVSWPAALSADSAEARVVPDVAGLSLRAAAGALHRAGLRAKVEGWGDVRTTVPGPGTQVPPGTLVTVRAGNGGSR